VKEWILHNHIITQNTYLCGLVLCCILHILILLLQLLSLLLVLLFSPLFKWAKGETFRIAAEIFTGLMPFLLPKYILSKWSYNKIPEHNYTVVQKWHTLWCCYSTHCAKICSPLWRIKQFWQIPIQTLQNYNRHWTWVVPTKNPSSYIHYALATLSDCDSIQLNTQRRICTIQISACLSANGISASRTWGTARYGLRVGFERQFAAWFCSSSMTKKTTMTTSILFNTITFD